MPRPSKGARLVWRGESRKPDGTLRNSAGWFIRDGGTFVSACGGTGDRGRAEIRLAAYLTEKYQPARERGRGADQILIADVVNVYLTDVAPRHAKPGETAARLTRVLQFFGERPLSDITGDLVRQFVAAQTSPAYARRMLEDLRSAANHYRREGYTLVVPAFPLPEKSASRERWLTRGEAARLLRAAWRMTQGWKGEESCRRTGQHLARFILVGLYTGTRSAAICGAATGPTEGHGFVDYERGVFYRRAAGARQTKKRQPPVRLPSRLLAHMRRWRDTEVTVHTRARGKSKTIGRKISHDFVVEWQGRPVVSVKKAFRNACEAARLGWYEGDGKARRFRTDITPHVLRHTAATWLMQAGADVWEAAGFLGMTVDTLIDTYGHHHPDFQADAAEKITSKRRGTTLPVKAADAPDAQKRNDQPAPHRNPTETPETNVNIRGRR